jgi:hypothetical protein
MNIRICDGMKFYGQQGGLTMVGFAPAWWRVDRWVFWLFLSVFRKAARGTVTMTQIREGGAIARLNVRVHAEDW